MSNLQSRERERERGKCLIFTSHENYLGVTFMNGWTASISNQCSARDMSLLRIVVVGECSVFCFAARCCYCWHVQSRMDWRDKNMGRWKKNRCRMELKVKHNTDRWWNNDIIFDQPFLCSPAPSPTPQRHNRWFDRLIFISLCSSECVWCGYGCICCLRLVDLLRFSYLLHIKLSVLSLQISSNSQNYQASITLFIH